MITHSVSLIIVLLTRFGALVWRQWVGLLTAKGGCCATHHHPPTRVSGQDSSSQRGREMSGSAPRDVSHPPSCALGSFTQVWKITSALVTLPVLLCSVALPHRETAASADPKAAHPEKDRKHLLSISFCFFLLLLLLLFICTCYSGSQVLARMQRCSLQLEHIYQCKDRGVCQDFLHDTWEHFETSADCLSKIPVKRVSLNSVLQGHTSWAHGSRQLHQLWSQSNSTLSADNLIWPWLWILIRMHNMSFLHRRTPPPFWGLFKISSFPPIYVQPHKQLTQLSWKDLLRKGRSEDSGEMRASNAVFLTFATRVRVTSTATRLMDSPPSPLRLLPTQSPEVS